MTRPELEHAIRAACDVAEDHEVYVFGSQAILGQYPDAPEALRQSAEADIAPKNRPDMADAIDVALGELSPFHETHGFYVHGLGIEAARLPARWEERAVIVQNRNTRDNKGICVEGHDLAASKLFAFRDKDKEFVRVLLSEGMIQANLLLRRIGELPVEKSDKRRLETWVQLTAKELTP
ncbi:MAG TPA: hypothetical protein VJ837_00470 [Candidatus Paceibacterota bacterium]|nr:hypothetical protein [Candidatus Paceibacterota bacterium]